MAFTWPELVGRADVVCLGTITQTEVRTVGQGVAEFSIATVHVTVISVLKGTTARKQITIDDWHLPQVKIPADKYIVFFLKSLKNGDDSLDYSLWDGWDDSLIALGNEPPHLPSSLTPLCTTGLLMANALAHANHERRWELLTKLSDVTVLYHPVAPDWVELARQVGQPKGIPSFWKQQIVPLVQPYVHDPDKEMAVSLSLLSRIGCRGRFAG